MPADQRIDKGEVVLRTGVVVTHNFTLLALANFVEAMRLATDVGDRSQPHYCEWHLMSVDGNPVRSSCGIEVTPWSKLQPGVVFDYLVVIGGLLDDSAEYDDVLIAYLRDSAKVGVPLVGLCTGSFILADAGLMDGLRCCVHGYHVEEFSTRFPKVNPDTSRIFLEDENIITCAGGIASFDLAAYLIERHCGRERALKIQHHAVIDRFRNGQHDQLPISDPYFDVSDRFVRNSLFIMEQNIHRSIPIDRIATMVGCSRRHLNRVFKSTMGSSPSNYFSAMRLNHASWLLANSNHSITEIATECGFSDGAHLARRFKAKFGKLPSEARVSDARRSAPVSR